MCADGLKILLPRPSTGLAKFKITKADIEGRHALPGDELLAWELDLKVDCDILMDAVEKQAFQRRVRYVKAMHAKQVDGGEKKEELAPSSGGDLAVSPVLLKSGDDLGE